MELQSPWKFYACLLFKLIPAFKIPVTFQLKNGGKIKIYEFMTLYIYKEIFFDKCYDFPSLIKDDPLILDIGANTGVFATRMKQLYKDSSIYCFEPFPTNFYQLQKNIKSSNFDNIKLHQSGVGGSTRNEKLFIHKKNIGGHSLSNILANSNNYIDIELIDINEVLKLSQGKKWDLVKMDCEGAEYEIIKCLTKESARIIKHIIFESSPSIYDVNELLKHLECIGFRIEKNKNILICLNDSV